MNQSIVFALVFASNLIVGCAAPHKTALAPQTVESTGGSEYAGYQQVPANGPETDVKFVDSGKPLVTPAAPMLPTPSLQHANKSVRRNHASVGSTYQ